MTLDATKSSNLYQSFCCLWGVFATGESINMNLRTVCTRIKSMFYQCQLFKYGVQGIHVSFYIYCDA